MDHQAYVESLREENRLLADLVGDADPTTPVPTCPGWSLRQLVRHVGRGDRWAAQIVAERVDHYLDPRAVREGKPPASAAGADMWLRDSPRVLFAAVSSIGPDTPVWTFTGSRRASWWLRRRLHETTVHRADAAISLGVDFEMPAELAADAISEWLDLLAARPFAPEAPAPLAPGSVLHLHATDLPGDTGSDGDSGSGGGTGRGAGAGEWLIEGGSSGVSWTSGHGKGAAAVRGRTVDLLLAITRRRPTGVEVLGDQQVWANWLANTAY